MRIFAMAVDLVAFNLITKINLLYLTNNFFLWCAHICMSAQSCVYPREDAGFFWQMNMFFSKFGSF